MNAINWTHIVAGAFGGLVGGFLTGLFMDWRRRKGQKKPSLTFSPELQEKIDDLQLHGELMLHEPSPGQGSAKQDLICACRSALIFIDWHFKGGQAGLIKAQLVGALRKAGTYIPNLREDREPPDIPSQLGG